MMAAVPEIAERLARDAEEERTHRRRAEKFRAARCVFRTHTASRALGTRSDRRSGAHHWQSAGRRSLPVPGAVPAADGYIRAGEGLFRVQCIRYVRLKYLAVMISPATAASRPALGRAVI